MELNSSNYLFTQIGASEAAAGGAVLGLPSSGDASATNKTVYYIDSTIRVIGANTGYRIDIPVRYIKVA